MRFFPGGQGTVSSDRSGKRQHQSQTKKNPTIKFIGMGKFPLSELPFLSGGEGASHSVLRMLKGFPFHKSPFVYITRVICRILFVVIRGFLAVCCSGLSLIPSPSVISSLILVGECSIRHSSGAIFIKPS